MTDCICHTEAVAFGYTDCDFCELHDDSVVTYDDLIAIQDAAIELAELAKTPYSPRWGELIDQHGEAKLISLGADI